MDSQRSTRLLLLATLVPLGIVLGVLAASSFGGDDPARPQSTLTTRTPAPPDDPSAPAPVSPEPPPELEPAPPPPAPSEPEPPLAGAEPTPESTVGGAPTPGDLPGWVPDGAERVEVGRGAAGATVFSPRAGQPRSGAVVVFIHGWVATDPHRYGPWIAHLVARGATIVYPAYQTRPALDPAAALPNLVDGVRAALDVVDVPPGGLVVAGHSAGGALAADYAAVAADEGLPAPSAVASFYPGRKLRHLPVPVPSADLGRIPRGTPMLVMTGERDTAVGSGTARTIAAAASAANTHLLTVRDDRIDLHGAPRTFVGAAQQAFWEPLDALVERAAAGGRGPVDWPAVLRRVG